MSSTARLGRNIVAGLIGQACGMATALLTAPIVIHGLGVSAYGLWNVATALGTWVGFVNMLFSTAVIRFVGEALGRGDTKAALEAHRAIRWMATAVSLSAAACLAGLAPWLAHHVLHVDVGQEGVATIVLEAQAVFTACQILAAVNSGVAVAHQRLDLYNLIRSLGAALQSGGAAVVVALGHGLIAVVWWVAAMQALEWWAFAWCARRLQPTRKTGRTRLDLVGWFRQVLGYGGPLLSGYAASQLFLPTSRILIGTLRPVAEVAYFTIPASLAGNVRLISTHIAHAVLPATSEAVGQRDQSALRQLYLSGLRWSWLTMVPLAGLAIVLGRQFIAAWIGVEISLRVGPLIPWLVLGMSILFLGGIPEVLAQGIGRPGPWAVMSLGAGVVNVVLGWWWISQDGTLGATKALFAAGLILTLSLFVWARRMLRLGWMDYLRALDVRVLAVTAAVAAVLSKLVPASGASILTVVAWGLAGGMVILLAAPWWLHPDERAWYRRQWANLRAR